MLDTILGTVIVKLTISADVKKVRMITKSKLRNTQVLKDFSGNYIWTKLNTDHHSCLVQRS